MPDDWAAAGAPEQPVAIPAVVRALADDAPIRPVWHNQLGGLTFALGDARFVKWAPPGRDLTLLEEAARLQWVGPYTPVPAVLDAGSTDDGATWLLTTRVPGTNAVSARWTAEPRVAVRAIGEGLRAFHDAVPADACPFEWSAPARVARARARAAAGTMDPSRWHPVHRHLTIDAALALVADPPPIDRIVVCHGDSCAPNTLLGEDGRWMGHVDLGAMGTGDRWADLAVATWSTEWNYGPGWEDLLLAAYGVAPDPDRTRYYRLLWDLGD